MYLYAPDLTRAFDTTNTSTTDGTRTKPMTRIFIKNFQDEDTEFPTANSPPTTHDPLESTILAQAHSTSRPTHTDTTNNTTNNTTKTLETTTLAQIWTQTKSAFRHPATKNYAATCDLLPSSERSRSGVKMGECVDHNRPPEAHRRMG